MPSGLATWALVTISPSRLITKPEPARRLSLSEVSTLPIMALRKYSAS